MIRCTMDTFDDYVRVTRVFASVKDPYTVRWEDLLERFSRLPDAPPGMSAGAGMVLGTAQLAAPYGSATVVQPPRREDGVELVRSAVDIGAVAIDTARTYTGSEEVIGQALEGGWSERIPVITKLSPLVALDAAASPAEAAAAAEISVLRSLQRLGRKVVPRLLLHRADHRTAWNGAIWARLAEIRDEGLIGELGVSVQNPEELSQAVGDPNVKTVQMPFNVLDWRWEQSGAVEALGTRSDLAVHVRSVYLQGLLLRNADQWPEIQDCEPNEVLDRLAALARELGRASVADLCVAWVRSHAWISGVVVGMERLGQLSDNANLFSRAALSTAEAAHVRSFFGAVPDRLLNPARWPQRSRT